MPRRAKYEIKAICNKCGKEATKNEEASTENWKVVNAICECGGRIIPVCYKDGKRVE